MNNHIVSDIEEVRDCLAYWADNSPRLLQADHYVNLVVKLNQVLGLLSFGTPVRRRYRLNVSTTSKGVKSYDATVELESDSVTLAAALREFDAMMEEMDARIHPEVDNA